MNETWVGVGVARDHFRRVHEAVRGGVRRGRARRRLPRQLPQLRPRDAPARGHRGHGPGRGRDADLEPLVRRRRPRRREARGSATASASSAASTSTCCTRRTHEAVREEVRRCLDAAMEGGGYVLRSTGQIFDAQAGLDRGRCARPCASSAATTDVSRYGHVDGRHDSSTSRPRPTGPPARCR